MRQERWIGFGQSITIVEGQGFDILQSAQLCANGTKPIDEGFSLALSSHVLRFSLIGFLYSRPAVNNSYARVQ
jgi:hypothetical protein